MSLSHFSRTINHWYRLSTLKTLAQQSPSYTLTKASRLLSALPSMISSSSYEQYNQTNTWKPNHPEPQPVTFTYTKQHSPHIIMSVSGRDQAGVAATFVRTVWEHGAELSHSRMAVLGGDFALIARIKINTQNDNQQAVSNAVLNALPGFSVSTRPSTPIFDLRRPRWRLSIIAPDRLGLASAVADSLAKCSVNVHELDAEAILDGSRKLFKMDGRVDIPDGKLTDIMVALSNVERNWNADIVIQPIVEWVDVGL